MMVKWHALYTHVSLKIVDAISTMQVMVTKIVSALCLQQYALDPFQMDTSYQATSVDVSICFCLYFWILLNYNFFAIFLNSNMFTYILWSTV